MIKIFTLFLSAFSIIAIMFYFTENSFSYGLEIKNFNKENLQKLTKIKDKEISENKKKDHVKYSKIYLDEIKKAISNSVNNGRNSVNVYSFFCKEDIIKSFLIENKIKFNISEEYKYCPEIAKNCLKTFCKISWE